MLVEAGANVNAVSNHTTPLREAVRKDVPVPGMVEYLIEKGADVNNIRGDGITILMDTTSYDLVKLLISNGADVNAIDRRGDSLLIRAVRAGDPERVKILLSSGADVNYRNTLLSRDALIVAASNGSLEILKDLCDKGAIIDSRTAKGLTPLMRACLTGTDEIAKELITRGADVNATDINGMTALMHASFIGNLKNIKTLIHNGAKLETVDNYNLNFMDHARDEEFREDLESLLRPEEEQKPIEARNIPENSTDYITFNTIMEGDAMVNLPYGPNSTNYNRGYYLKNTQNTRELRKNPLTRHPLTRKNFRAYKAHIVPKKSTGGTKKRKNKTRNKRSP
jgi:ankyrin repeat protein